MSERDLTSRNAALTTSSAPPGLLQRACACGQHTGGGGECDACQDKRQNPLQRRASSDTAQSAVPPIVHEVLRSPGQPLDPATRAFMEPRFGHDFSYVRVHTDTRAAESASAVNALAYTVGSDVVFAGGRYEPRTARGERLLAHELTHVAQQGESAERPLGAQLKMGAAATPFEAEAAAGESMLGALRPISAAREPALQRTDAGTALPAAGKSPPPKTPAREVIAIKLDHSENSGLGRFDTLLYSDCTMMVQFRMNFNFKGAWPNDKAKKDWQQRFITSVRAGWSKQFTLDSADCKNGCNKVAPFIQIFAPHSSPHVVVDVTYTDKWIQSSAGSGTANLDSLDLRADDKGGPEKQVGALHEFGHLSGLDDKYIKDKPECAPGYPKEGVMCMGSTITNKDYEPFANALNDMTKCNYKVGASMTPAKPKEGHAGLGGVLGAIGGAASGAAIGAAFGGIGAGIGAAIGLAVGAGAGALIGSAV
jgi:hypothetical protein